MKAREADRLGKHLASLLREGSLDAAHTLLAPVLAERTRFALLDRIGAALAPVPEEVTDAFLDHVAAGRTEGGWVVIASALRQRLGEDPAGAFSRSRAYIVSADTWYGADIFGEPVPGPALVADLHGHLPILAAWREDPNRWVRRTIGVAVHFWAKRSRGAPERAPDAETLLAFLEPMFGKWEMDAVKGVGWGLKTLGRHYPHLVADWLVHQVSAGRRHRALMLRKALTYLPEDERERVVRWT